MSSSSAFATEERKRSPSNQEQEHPPAMAGVRSCLECRRRKIRCDRAHPCAYCARLRLRCRYPQLIRTPVAGVETSEPAITQRLERVEAVVQSLKPTAITTLSHNAIQSSEFAQLPSPPDGNNSARRTSEAVEADDSERETGRLVFEKGDSRYVSEGFWASIDEEAAQETSSVDHVDNGVLSDALSSVASHQKNKYNSSFVFGFSSVLLDLQVLHPPVERMFVLWQVYLDNVDPLIKMIHTPSVQRQILQASKQIADIPPAVEALMFAIYYAAVISIQGAERCEQDLGEDRELLLERYRFGIERALSRANFLKSQDITVLQAFVLFLICARRDNNGPDVWTLIGLVVRIATKLGLHRDGSALNLLPYQIELRRRLWWQICILDVRTAEDSGTDPAIYEHTFNTKLPLNLNDSDLDRGMSDSPTESASKTEMLFSLQRFEISYAVRKILFSDKFTRDNSYPMMTTTQKGYFVEELQSTIEQRYIRNYDMKVPLCFVTATAGKLILAKLRLIIHHTARKRGEQGLQDIEKALFTTSVEILEYTHALRTNESYQRWAWLFQTYVEWDALAYLLLSLPKVRGGECIARAWNAVNKAFSDWEDDHVFEAHEHRWRRIEELKARALAADSGTSMRGQELTNQNLAPAVPYMTLNYIDQGSDAPELPSLQSESIPRRNRTRQIGKDYDSGWAFPTQFIPRECMDSMGKEVQSQAIDLDLVPTRTSNVGDDYSNNIPSVTTRAVDCQGMAPVALSNLPDTIDWNFNMLASDMNEDFSWDTEIGRGLNLSF